MWLVRVALQRPYTFVVMSMLIVVMGVLSIVRMPTDIFPNIDIPVISVVWNYGGLPPEEMERRIVSNFERFLTTTVNDIEHIESQSLTGVAVIKIFFQPGAKIEAAIAQVTAVSQAAVRMMPPGATPPLIIRYSASNVPILQLALGQRHAQRAAALRHGRQLRPRRHRRRCRARRSRGRTAASSARSWSTSTPSGSTRWGLSPRDVNTALGRQNVILPTGTAKMGATEYPVTMNSSPELLDEIGDLRSRPCAARPSTCATSPTCATATRRRPTWCTSAGRRSVLMIDPEERATPARSTWSPRIRAMLPATLAKLPPELKASLALRPVGVRARRGRRRGQRSRASPPA